MSNLRKTQNGSFNGNALFKVRRISTGLFFKPEYRNPKWEEGGRVYKTLPAARTAAASARYRDEFCNDHAVPDSDLEVVEFHVVEAERHSPTKGS